MRERKKILILCASPQSSTKEPPRLINLFHHFFPPSSSRLEYYYIGIDLATTDTNTHMCRADITLPRAIESCGFPAPFDMIVSEYCPATTHLMTAYTMRFFQEIASWLKVDGIFSLPRAPKYTLLSADSSKHQNVFPEDLHKFLPNLVFHSQVMDGKSIFLNFMKKTALVDAFNFAGFLEITKKVLARETTPVKMDPLDAAIKCFDVLFLKDLQQHYQKYPPRNEFLLDFETPADPLSPDAVVVHDGPEEYYVFSVSELLEWIDDELSNSTVVYEAEYRVTSLVRSFRLPRNPYTNKTLLPAQLAEIWSQVLYRKMSGLIDRNAVLRIFFHQYLQFDFSLTGYDSTANICQVLQSHGLKFNERYTNTTNLSRWVRASVRQ